MTPARWMSTMTYWSSQGETLMTLHAILSARWELVQADRITGGSGRGGA